MHKSELLKIAAARLMIKKLAAWPEGTNDVERGLSVGALGRTGSSAGLPAGLRNFFNTSGLTNFFNAQSLGQMASSPWSLSILPLLGSILTNPIFNAFKSTDYGSQINDVNQRIQTMANQMVNQRAFSGGDNE